MTKQVSADVYFDFERVPDQLPSWAKSKFEFVYEMRKRLEGQEISSVLHDWIELTFGGHHPKRRVPEQVKLDFSYELPDNIRWAVTMKVSSGRASFGFVLDDFELVILRLDFRAPLMKMTLEMVGTFPCTDSLVFIPSQDFLAYSVGTSTLIRVNEHNCCETVRLYVEAPLFAKADDIIVVCDRHGSLGALAFKAPTVRLIAQVGAALVAVAASWRFRIVACAALDGVVLIFELETGAEIMNYQTKDDITLMAITPGWGFVLAVSREKVFLFTANGELVKVVGLTMEIAQMFVHQSLSGQDCMSFVSSTGEMGVFEAFYPEQLELIGKVKNGRKVMRICRNPFHRWFLVAYTDGSIMALPPIRDFCG
jgi:hypothetical protein